MVRRTATALLLLLVILPAIYFGGVLYFFYVGVFALMAAWEYLNMFSSMGFEPSRAVSLLGVAAILATRAFWPQAATAALTAAILVASTIHLIAYERGRDQAALDLGMTLGGILYLGWLVGYMIDLRNLPNGGWWVTLVFPVVWLADSGGYFIGVRYGRHKLAPRLSPKKSWEGYWAGVVGGSLMGGLFAFAYTRFGPLDISILSGILLGLALSTLTTLGDLAESLFKRFANLKDSGTLFPGHGGAFDRIDSLIWAGAIGYFWIRFLLPK